MRSAEPEPATTAQRDELTVTAGEQPREMDQWIKDLAAGLLTRFARAACQLAARHVPAVKHQVDGEEAIGEPCGLGSFLGYGTRVAAG